MLGRAANQIKHRAAILVGGVDVEKAQLVSASSIVGDGGINWIACIAQAYKVHAFDHAAIGDI